MSVNREGNLHAQDQHFSDVADSLWTPIEDMMELETAKPSYHFISYMVRDYCKEDYDCLYETYQALMYKLERSFNLPAAVYVCDEIVKITHKEAALKAEANAYKDLFRYHGALGNSKLAVENMDKSLQLYEELGDFYSANYVKMSKLEQSFSYRDSEEVLQEMDKLLKESELKKDTSSIIYLNRRLINTKRFTKQYDEMEKHLLALENILVADPLLSHEYAITISINMGRANLAMSRENFPLAEKYYQKTLHLSETEPDKWIEIKILHSLSELEWNRKNRSLAKSYLEKANAKAQQLELHDLLIENYGIKEQIALDEGRYKVAYQAMEKKNFHKNKLEERGKGFDLQSHYLQLEKEQLATEKTNNDLLLKLKNSQLRYSILLAVLIFLLALGFLISLFKHRKGMRILGEQNTLIQEQSKKLTNLDKAKSKFFANVSHELRTPLTLLLGSVQSILKENKLNQKQKQLLHLAKQSGQQLEQLVREILDLRKLEMGKMLLDLKPTKLTFFCRSYFEQFESLAQNKQIDFSYSFSIDEELIADIDQTKFRQILYNLLSNAFKFTPSGGKIVAIISNDKETLKLEVADSGSGIHPDDLPHVFDRYFQTNQLNKPAEGGTGIGLALCKEYAKLFEGSIEVNSTLGHGAVFKIVFPLIRSATEIPSIKMETVEEVFPQAGFLKTKKQEQSANSKPKILVVEDNPQLQQYLHLILSEKYQVSTVENGKKALEKIDVKHPALIISDLMMPVMDGFQLLENLKTKDKTRHIPVIMLTARAEMQDKLKALRIGVDDYLVKPFDEEELLVRIENLLINQIARQIEFSSNNETQQSLPVLSEADQSWLKSFESFVHKNLSIGILSVSMLAKEFAMSESTLLRQLKRLTGLTPVQYLIEIRLNLARNLLENRTYKSVSRVASEVGYADSRSFSRSFKNRFGKSPSSFLSQ